MKKFNINKIYIFIFLNILLSNCTPARLISDNFSQDTKTSKVKIIRESSFLFGGVPAIFGYDENDKVRLWSGGKSEVNVPIGKHEFFVRSNQADRPYKMTIEITEEKQLCLVVSPDSEPIAKFLLFPLYWFSHAFKFEEKESGCL